MKKLRYLSGIFNYGCTWLGLFRIALGVGCSYGAYRLFLSDEALFLRIFGVLIMGLAVFGCLYAGGSNIKEGYNHLKYRDAERLLYREPNPYYKNNKDE